MFNKEGEDDMNPIAEEEMKILLKAQQGELDAVLMYNALADTVKRPEGRGNLPAACERGRQTRSRIPGTDRQERKEKKDQGCSGTAFVPDTW